MDKRNEAYRDARVARLAEEFLGYCDRAERASGGRWEELSDHLRRAAASILTNTGEALDETSRGDRVRLLRYAYRSSGECERSLRGFQRVGALPDPLLDEGFRRIKDIKLDLRRLTAWANHS